MKQIISNAKRICTNKDGFIYGLIRGSFESLFFISALLVVEMLLR